MGVSVATALPAAAVIVTVIMPVALAHATEVTLVVAAGAVKPWHLSTILGFVPTFSATMFLTAEAASKPSDTRARIV